MKQVLIACAILMWAGAANAAQVTIQSISGTWDVENVVDQFKGTFGKNGNLSGDGTSQIRWGNQFPGYKGGRSGFRFEEKSKGSTHDTNTLFNVGVFTHMNRVIYQGQHLDTAWLNLTVTASFDGIVRTFNTSYRFSLWETPNLDNPCANGGANGDSGMKNQNGCADRVQILKNDAVVDTFTDASGRTYSFELFGFEKGAEFWTVENFDNHAWLKAKFNVTGGPTPVPLPAGAWLMLAGLGALGLMRRVSRR